jgi:hypothetical protein
MILLNRDQPPSLKTALAALEDVLESPVVPGELTEWCSRAKTDFEKLHDLYIGQTRPSHAKQIAEIRDQDQEMGTIVARLEEEDKAIVVEMERLGAILQAFIDHVDEKAERSDNAISERHASGEDQRRSLVDGLLALVIRVRTHEKSLQTWFFEAFQRDRGIAD